jgi:hypothetical protein
MPDVAEQLASPDAWAKKNGTNPHLLAGAKVHLHWVEGDMISEEEYFSGIKAFNNEPLR